MSVPFLMLLLLLVALAIVMWRTGVLRHGAKAARPSRIGPYLVQGLLGAGGMGAVYRGVDTRSRRAVAVKLPSRRSRPASLRRFEREAEIVQRIAHPNVVAAYEAGRTTQGVPWYAMERLDGVTFEQIVARHGRQPWHVVQDLLSQAAAGIGALHAQGMVHRDVKPANIILCKDGSVKIIDLGLAKPQISPHLTADGQLIGSPLYMAPEVIQGADADARSDVYALGAVGYFLLTGVHPFAAKSIAEVCVRHMQQPPTPPSQLGVELPAELEATLMASLRKDPADRPGDAERLSEALSS